MSALESAEKSSPAERILVAGANGQDGTYAVERLLAEGLDTHGLCHSEDGAARLRARFPAVIAHVCDLTDSAEVAEVVNRLVPTQIINLSGTSVSQSWDQPSIATDVLGVGAVRLLEAAWRLQERTGRPVRVLQASSAEAFGATSEVPQREDTRRFPVSPYGAAKSFALDMVEIFRRRGLFASSAILYNHESPVRPEGFVSRKITAGVAAIALGQASTLTLGNIDVFRDWGYAPDYLDAMLLILRSTEPGDFIVASGEPHSVREFVDVAFRRVGIPDWDRHVVIDPAFYRPADPNTQVGDSSRLRALGWKPTVSFAQLVELMVDADLERLRRN